MRVIEGFIGGIRSHLPKFEAKGVALPAHEPEIKTGMWITPAQFKYLYIQRGEVADAFHDGFEAWKNAYEQSLANIMASIDPVLPDRCDRLLDVGSGLGGIDVLLARRFPDCTVVTLDGANDKSVVRSHRETFNNVELTKSFLRDNGVAHHVHCTVPYVGPFPQKFDLVVSFAAWGFHLPPEMYLDLVTEALNPGAVIILDVRRDKQLAYVPKFNEAWGSPRLLETGKKHVRLAWKVR